MEFDILDQFKIAMILVIQISHVKLNHYNYKLSEMSNHMYLVSTMAKPKGREIFKNLIIINPCKCG